MPTQLRRIGLFAGVIAICMKRFILRVSRIIQLIAACLLLAPACVAQYGLQDPGPLLAAYRKSKPDTGRVNLLMQISELYVNRTDKSKAILDSAALLAGESRELSQRLGYDSGVSRSNYLLGRVMQENQDFVHLAKLLPVLNGPDRLDLTMNAIYVLLNPPDRTPRRMDTAFALAHQYLSLSRKDTALTAQLLVLLEMALRRYCSLHPDFASPPSPAWTSHDTSGRAGDRLEPILSWMGLQFKGEQHMTDDLSDFRERLQHSGRYKDVENWMEEQRFLFVSVFDDEGNYNNFSKRAALAAKQYQLAVEFDLTGPEIDPALFYNTGYFFMDQGALQTALHYGMEAVRRLDREKTVRPYAHTAYYIVGRIYYELNQPQLSMSYYRQALDRIRAQGQTPNGQILNFLTDTWLALDSPRAALSYLRDSIPTGMMQDPYSQTCINTAMGECYYALGDYDKAQSMYVEAWNQAGKQKHAKNVPNSASLYLGKIYAKTRQYDKARAMLEGMVSDSALGFLTIGDIKKAHYLLFQVDSATGNFVSAIHHLQAFRALNDSIFDLAKNDQIQNLTIQYASDQKDKDILIQKAALHQSDITRKSLIAGAILLVVLLGLVYNRYRLKQKSNRLLEERQDQIDARNQKLVLLNKQQLQLLNEKEWLVREIHHRVKNNLQIILSLLNMQASGLKDEVAYHAFGEARSRLYTISLIHQRLYKEDSDLTTVFMPEYIGELIEFLCESFPWGELLQFRLEIDPISLGVAQCVPVGLILNEAVTNAVKYAFPELTKIHRSSYVNGLPPQSGPDSARPAIFVALKLIPNNLLELIISDNGQGLPPGETIGQNESMGMELIQILSEQLGGATTLNNHQGLTVTIHFPVENKFHSS